MAENKWGFACRLFHPTNYITGSGAHLCCFGDTCVWGLGWKSTAGFKSPQGSPPARPTRTGNINDVLVTKKLPGTQFRNLGGPCKRIILPSLSLGISTLFLGLESKLHHAVWFGWHRESMWKMGVNRNTTHPCRSAITRPPFKPLASIGQKYPQNGWKITSLNWNTLSNYGFCTVVYVSTLFQRTGHPFSNPSREKNP